MNTEKHMIHCSNCGGLGHVYRNCNHPITSYGIVLFRLFKNPLGEVSPEYLMIQRKDSLSYVEFVRGKYSLDQKNYLLKLFSNMTPSERANLQTCEFDHLWNTLWQAKDAKGFIREYSDAKHKFDLLKKGYILRKDKSDVTFFDIEFILEHTQSSLSEAEWGFPKGRRNVNENDVCCAIREFKEETGINPKYIKLLGSVKPFEEVFSGTNRVRYKHIYYLAVCERHDIVGRVSSREIKDVKWLKYQDAQDKILPHNVERKELFKRVHSFISKYS